MAAKKLFLRLEDLKTDKSNFYTSQNFLYTKCMWKNKSVALVNQSSSQVGLGLARLNDCKNKFKKEAN